MHSSLVQSIGAGSGAATIAVRIEALIAAGELRPGERLAPVRTLAAGLGVSPATVAARYRRPLRRRLLQAELRPGDRVAVEDPGWPRIGDLVSAIGLRAEPVAVDSGGLVPDRLAAALRAGARAVIATPRGQNPTGAVIGAQRAAQLRDVLTGYPHVLVVEDDYIAGIAGAPYAAVHGRSDRWTVVRSVSKVLGPDLRLATLAADPLTISRVAGRQLLGPGWVSH